MSGLRRPGILLLMMAGIVAAETNSPPEPVRNLAVLKIVPFRQWKVGRTTPLPATIPVRVQIQNRGDFLETIPDMETLTDFLHLTIKSLGDCPPGELVDILYPYPPIKLRPKQKKSIAWAVRLNCVNDPERGPEHRDYSYAAVLNPAALGPPADAQPADDICPRPPFGDDSGCGTRDENGVRGAPVFTDPKAP
jgi:hypothetical protein